MFEQYAVPACIGSLPMEYAHIPYIHVTYMYAIAYMIISYKRGCVYKCIACIVFIGYIIRYHICHSDLLCLPRVSASIFSL